MKKIAVVISCNLYLTPYYKRYEELLNRLNVPFELIMWDREGINETPSVKTHRYTAKDQPNNGNWVKVLHFIGFGFFVSKIIKREKYDKIVFLGTYACIPALLAGFLEKHYKEKYWVDLRDITYESNKLFSKMEDSVFKNSYKTVVSSKGFVDYLPKSDYGFIHNIDPMMDEFCSHYKHTESDRIRISYIGNIGYWDACREFIDVFANDNRFSLQFFGRGSDKVKKYCAANRIQNVVFDGEFPRENTVQYYSNTDVVYNVYGNNSVNLRTAVSNKYYYAVRFGLPMLVSAGTYMADLIKKNDMGICFENDAAFPDVFYNWYSNYSSGSTDAVWKEIEEEDRKAINSFKDFIHK